MTVPSTVEQMPPELLYVVYSAALTWVMLMTASLLRARMWNPQGVRFAFSNRDQPPEPTPVAARAHRAAKNMLENFLLFAVLVLVARLGGVPSARLELGAAIFFWARVAYFAVYLAGIAYVRTVVWGVSVVGLAMIVGAIVAG